VNFMKTQGRLETSNNHIGCQRGNSCIEYNSCHYSDCKLLIMSLYVFGIEFCCLKDQEVGILSEFVH